MSRVAPPGTPPAYVQVALPLPVRKLFSYRVPAGLPGASAPGSRAVVPFGKRSLTGVIATASPEIDIDPSRVRDVIALPDRAPVLGPSLLAMLLWASRYYVAGPGNVLAAALPPAASRRDPSGLRMEVHYALTVPVEEALEACRRAPRQRRVVEALRGGEPVPQSGLRRLLGEGIPAAVAALRRRGILAAERRPAAPARLLDAGPAAPPRRLILTGEQQAAVDTIASSLETGAYRGFLLVGPTGSGKTEVYLACAEEALRRGRSVIYLVPEISLTPLLARTIRSRFGDAFALLHSSLGPGERRGEWERIRSGAASVVLGPRSALFAPVERLGLVVVDEEQDASFKQEGEPRYNARDLALVRARHEGAAAILGSATPSMESCRLAETGRLERLALSERIASRPMAVVEVVDMKREAEETGGDEPVSRRLREEMRECLARGDQAIVLLNRRGWAPALRCRKCGETVRCRRCSISLTWHRADARLLCHYCGYRRGLPASCPDCGGTPLQLAGTGTEKLAEELAALFPEARFARLDRDVARGREAAGRILESFERGEADVLVGTQLVAKGHDFPRVTLVGVMSADFTLGFPDFRAAERTFQILTQVAGRAGRGERPGRVVVQAWRPDHYAIQAAARQDFEEFYRKESRFRRLMGYPPWTAMASVICSGTRAGTALRRAEAVAAALRAASQGKGRVTGPAPAPLERLKGKYRFQILVRTPRRGWLPGILDDALRRLEGRGGTARDLAVDVDPASLL